MTSASWSEMQDELREEQERKDARMKYTLKHGIHNGSFTSRDHAMPETFDTREMAIQAYQDHKKFYKSIGYVIWYVEIVAPDESVDNLDGNSSYN